MDVSLNKQGRKRHEFRVKWMNDTKFWAIKHGTCNFLNIHSLLIGQSFNVEHPREDLKIEVIH